MQLDSLILFGWLMFLAYWWISAIGVKKSVRRRSWRLQVCVRILLIVLVVVLFRLQSVRTLFQHRQPASFNSVAGIASLVLYIAGFALAIWARRRLGRNWGMPMSLRQGHELVTTGPYRYVRHPIYTGILLAMLGSALAAGGLWLVIFIYIGIYSVYSARTEEQLMMREFPEQYAQYKRRTKALVPFVI
jgi:protein-S-isoprenylcysteine O-methyltransferase Ste14